MTIQAVDTIAYDGTPNESDCDVTRIVDTQVKAGVAVDKRPQDHGYYEEAVAAYCRMFNTTEKDIRKSVFKDETLGYTLYDLAMQYSKIDISKTYYYASLAAKSGNASAIEYCRKSKISF